MEKSFSYFYTMSALGQLDVNDIGNCTIEGIDAFNQVYYLVIKTDLGLSTIMEVGPYIIDSKALPHHCSISYKRINYDEAKLIKAIESFLNNPRRDMVQAREIDEELVYENAIDILGYVKNNCDFGE